MWDRVSTDKSDFSYDPLPYQKMPGLVIPLQLSDRHARGSQNLVLVHLIQVVTEERHLQRNKQAGKCNMEALFNRPTCLLNRLHPNLDTHKNQQKW